MAGTTPDRNPTTDTVYSWAMLVHVFLPQTRNDLVDHPIIEDVGEPGVRFCFDNCTWMWPPEVEAHEGAQHTLKSQEGMMPNTIEGTLNEGEITISMAPSAKVHIRLVTQKEPPMRFYSLKKWDSRDADWVHYLSLIDD